jgi:hypothetical protein
MHFCDKKKCLTELTTVINNNLLAGLAVLGAIGLDLLDNVHALNNLSEDNVPVVQPGGLHGRQEELGAIGVGASVSHREDAWRL